MRNPLSRRKPQTGERFAGVFRLEEVGDIQTITPAGFQYVI